MLKTLQIQNFILFDEVILSFGSKLNVLTGETGAGKSILTDALSVLLGGRAFSEWVRSSKEKAEIQALFELEEESVINPLLEERGLASKKKGELLLQREITSSGTSRAWVNGKLVSVSLLSEVTESLIDIHSQHEHQSLLEPRRHLSLLDSYSGISSDVKEFESLFKKAKQVFEELSAIESSEREKEKLIDLYNFQVKEIKDAMPREGEEEELISEHSRLVYAEKLTELLNNTLSALQNEEGGAIVSIGTAIKAISNICRIDLATSSWQKKAENLQENLAELASEIRRYNEKIEFSPARLEEVSTRLATYERLKRKYGNSMTEIREFKNNAEKELKTLESREERKEDLTKEFSTLKVQLSEKALALHNERSKSALKMEKAVEDEIRELGMPGCRFKVAIRQEEEPLSFINWNGLHYKVTDKGCDFLEFLISPNPGEEPRPLRKIASGGELSRIMLAIKTVLTEVDDIPTLVFDEIDAGIGGRAGEVIGRKLKALSRNHQLFCITHLPQIAAFADDHFYVEKKASEGMTKVKVKQLSKEERIKEIAKMLAGEKITDVAIKHAKEILERC